VCRDEVGDKKVAEPPVVQPQAIAVAAVCVCPTLKLDNLHKHHSASAAEHHVTRGREPLADHHNQPHVRTREQFEPLPRAAPCARWCWAASPLLSPDIQWSCREADSMNQDRHRVSAEGKGGRGANAHRASDLLAIRPTHSGAGLQMAGRHVDGCLGGTRESRATHQPRSAGERSP
jgi:hypothetical protein